MAKKVRVKEPEAPAGLPSNLDWTAVHKAALILEKAKLGDYVALMGRPWHNIWVNFLAGIARGAGMVVGTVLVGGLVVILLVQSLKVAFHHAGGVPWVGAQVKEAVGFILEAANEKMDDSE
jgi:hypothetical protein